MKVNLDEYIGKAKECLVNGIYKYLEVYGTEEFQDKPTLTENETLVKGIATNISISDDTFADKLLSLSIIKEDGEEYIVLKYMLETHCIVYTYIEEESLSKLNQIIEGLYENQN